MKSSFPFTFTFFLFLLVPDHHLLFLFPHKFISGMCACEDLCATIYKKVRKYTQMEGAKGMTYMFYFTDDSVSY